MTFQLEEEHIAEILHIDNSYEWYSAMKEMFSKYEINPLSPLIKFIPT